MHYWLVRQLNRLLPVHQKYVGPSHAIACDPLPAHDPPLRVAPWQQWTVWAATAPVGPMLFASGVDLRNGMATRNGAQPCLIIFVPSWPRSFCPVYFVPFNLSRLLCPVYLAALFFPRYFPLLSSPGILPVHDPRSRSRFTIPVHDAPRTNTPLPRAARMIGLR